ncbi:MAG TPA: hypothetical protein VHW73_07195 [Rudaea sp.]|jgi:tellurite resistance protein|nr:hypothetical protein [Rudaea sp.]
MIRVPVIPASFFGIVLGLAGVGNGWRFAAKIWPVPTIIADVRFALALIAWLIVALLYVLKWIFARDAAMAELAHPVLCCFIGLSGASTLAFSFGVTALPAACLRLVTLGIAGPIAAMALPLFVIANVFIAVLTVPTLMLLFRGRLLPPPTPAIVAIAQRS